MILWEIKKLMLRNLICLCNYYKITGNKKIKIVKVLIFNHFKIAQKQMICQLNKLMKVNYNKMMKMLYNKIVKIRYSKMMIIK